MWKESKQNNCMSAFSRVSRYLRIVIFFVQNNAKERKIRSVYVVSELIISKKK